MAIVALTITINLGLFFLGGGAVHWWFHGRLRERESEWKHQPGRFQSRRDMLAKLPLVLLNGLIIQLATGLGIWAMCEGHTRAFWGLEEHGTFYAVLSTLAMFLWYHVALYYVHRAMHHPQLFRRFHHIHHEHKAPMFLDALYEHPVEALWGAFVLTAPLYLFPIYAWSYFLFIAVVGVHEILDHAGINLNVPLLSKSSAHDEHHRRSSCYYGQLLPFLDRIHGCELPDPANWRARSRDQQRPAQPRD